MATSLPLEQPLRHPSAPQGAGDQSEAQPCGWCHAV